MTEDNRLETESVSTWIAKTKVGDTEASRRLWQRYFESLASFAKQKLPAFLKQMADEEDIALSAMHSLLAGLKNGELDAVRDRDDLWKILTLIAARKVKNHVKFETRQKRDVRLKRGDSVFSREEVKGEQAKNKTVNDPAWLVEFSEISHRFFELLPNDRLRQIAGLRLEGHSVESIAKVFSVSERTIERKLGLIRTTWIQMIEEDFSK